MKNLIKGGVAITYWDKEQIFGKIGYFLHYEELNSIVNKVLNNQFKSLISIIYASEVYKFTKKFHEEHPEVPSLLSKGHQFDLKSNVFQSLKNYFFDEKPNDNNDYIKIIGLNIAKKRAYKFIRRDFIKNHENLDKWKIFVPASNGGGVLGEVLTAPIIGEPIIGHTQTFISIGAFNTKEEAEALLKYVKTKFARTMLGTLKITQGNNKRTWANVPLQDFTNSSDIDWSKSVAEIDKQLYKKYGLSEEEINFIEEKVKEMK